jgi:uncharacterized tellurite resistance protein B-like protein
MKNIANLFESGEQSRQKGHFMNLVMLARIDGDISRLENQLLLRIARRLSLTDEQVKEIIDHPEDYPMIPPVSREERYERFIQLIQLLVADGQADKEEEQLVKRFGVALGFTPERIDEKFPVILEHLRKGMTRESVLEAVM